jgi:single-strand DNA-binding protein
MASSILDQVTIVGNVGNVDRDNSWHPAHDNMSAMFSFSIAVTPRVQNPQTNQWEDGEPTWHNVTAYGQLAENLHNSIHKGDQIIVIGHNKTSKRKDANTGEERAYTNVIADFAGPSLRWATATITRNENNGAGTGGRTTGESAHRSARPAPARTTTAPAAPANDDNDLSTEEDDFDALFN